MAASLAPEVNLNAPCPCGSGRKYKRCCWAARKTELAREQQAVGGAANLVLHFAEQRFPGLLGDSWNAVLAPLRERFDYYKLDSFLQRARDHLFVNLVDAFVGDRQVEGDKTLVDLFLADQASANLHPVARAYLSAWSAASFSLYEVEQVNPGEGLVLKDLLGDRQLSVAERSVSQSLEPWTTVFFRVAELPDGARLTSGVYVIPRECVDWFRARLEQDRESSEEATLPWPQYFKRRWPILPQLWVEMNLDPHAALHYGHDCQEAGCTHDH